MLCRMVNQQCMSDIHEIWFVIFKQEKLQSALFYQISKCAKQSYIIINTNNTSDILRDKLIDSIMISNYLA
jgi:hypothetical protein